MPSSPDPPHPDPTLPSRGVIPWVPPSVEEMGRFLANYQVLSLLGRGGMGAVYLALHTSLDRSVAIKLLPLEISGDEVFAQRFIREARAMAKLSHPHIVTVHDFGKTEAGHLYFVMEFVDGANLHSMIRAAGLQPAHALSIAGQVCEALSYAHGKGIIHRDIKPANVLVDQSGQAKVSDFGIARLIEPGEQAFHTTQTGMVIGTPDYMAPEQMKGQHADHRADIYSLGVMLYEMLCGEVPRGIFAPPSQRVNCDARVDRVVITAMQQKPELRYQSTTEMKAAVDTARAFLPRAARGNVSRVRAAAMLASVVAIVGAVAFFNPSKKEPVAAVPASAIGPNVGPPTSRKPGSVRGAAEWLFRVGDRESYLTATIVGTDHEVRIKTVNDIPAGEWEIVEMWLDRSQAPADLPPVTREDFIAYTSGLTRLRGFYVRQVEVRDADLAFLARNPDLESLRLVSVPVTDGVLAHVSSLKKLRVFDVGGARAFTGRDMANLACLPVLDDLVVCQTEFTDAAVRALAACPQLRVAQISETAISDDSLRALKTHPTLQEIYLDRAAITDTGLAELAALKTLKKLSLVGAPVSDDAVAAMQKALPECRIVRTIP